MPQELHQIPLHRPSNSLKFPWNVLARRFADSLEVGRFMRVTLGVENWSHNAPLRGLPVTSRRRLRLGAALRVPFFSQSSGSCCPYQRSQDAQPPLTSRQGLDYHVTGNVTLIILPGISFDITLHSLYRKCILAERILLYVTLSWPQPSSCTPFLLTLDYIKYFRRELILRCITLQLH